MSDQKDDRPEDEEPEYRKFFRPFVEETMKYMKPILDAFNPPVKRPPRG